MSQKIKTSCCAILGHVDVGKTKLLDYMRRTTTLEASGITQQIGTTLYSRERLEKLVGDNLKNKFKLDSMLMIDTPGHECFDMIRGVAMQVADVVILMVDMLKGLEKQTTIVIKLLLELKVPFIVCVNKIDRIYGWTKPKNDDNLNISNVLKRMSSDTLSKFHNYVRQIQSELYDCYVSSELYYKNKNPNEITSIVPISAETGEGIPDLIMLISSMAEKKYFSNKLITADVSHGYILDSHYDKHHGTYYVALHRNGLLSKGDTILINSNKCTIKHILTNANNKEIKDDHKFLRVDSIDRSLGIGIILDATKPIEPASMYILESHATRIDPTEVALKTKSSNDYENSWSSLLVKKKSLCLHIL